MTKIHNKKILFSFDIEQKVEESIIQQINYGQIDILQVAHHGSNTSSHIKFLQKCQPKYCLISNYKSIRQQVQKRLQKYCKIFSTKQYGNLKIIINQQIIRVETEYEL